MTQDTSSVVARKKLIEVALPLDAINAASKREKSIRHGHPSTLHLWWARRPLATARAVIFAQMVDDPSANSNLFQGKRAQEHERQRLFGIIEELVKWENTTNEAVLERARAEIWQSWRRACAENANHPRAKELFDRHVLPAFHDPFAGGGALPLEAQRLGMEAHASDLNPVAVLITKAMIEIPPMFAGTPPVNPQVRGEERLIGRTWRGAQGLAEDVRSYGQWMREEAEQRIGHLYPRVRVTEEMLNERSDLAPYVGRDLTVIAWLWARTVKSPNPAFADVDVPLASTFVLSKKKGNEAYVEPVILDGGYRFAVKAGVPPDAEAAKRGTKSGGSHSSFVCLMSGTPMPFDYLRTEAKAGRLGANLMAIVAEGSRGRVYLPGLVEHQLIAQNADPGWKPTVDISHWPGRTNVVEYGLTAFADLFTDRQLVALTTFSDLVTVARERIYADAVATGMPDDDVHLREGGTGATAYAEAVAVCLALALSRSADRGSSLCSWDNSPKMEALRNTFGRQALPMVWDFAEGNAFSRSSGNWSKNIDWVAKTVVRLPCGARGESQQLDAMIQGTALDTIISTDPPYYDNIGYAGLSDFFYVWLRRSLQPVFPDLFATLAVPKAEELVAIPYRHGSRAAAETFFLDGMTRALHRLLEQTHPEFPVTIYYAFKQSERRGDTGASSTGWETFLDAVIRSGFAVTGTWPMRTELSNRMIGMGSNALASSVVLSCRPRSAHAPSATRREFQARLRTELPQALTHMQRSNIAPVDLAQASIGPGMAVFTRYREVLNADGSQMSVGDALGLINSTLDEVLTEQDDDIDADSRWGLAWFEQSGYDEGEYGVAETLSTAKNTSVEGLVRAGIVESRRGAVRMLKPSELDPNWDPATDSRLSAWEMTQHLIRALESDGEAAAAALVSKLGTRAEPARDLAYRLYVLSERRKRAADAVQYNSLVQSWPEIARLANERPNLRQIAMPSQAEDGP